MTDCIFIQHFYAKLHQQSYKKQRAMKVLVNIFNSGAKADLIMRPSSLGGGRIMRRTPSVCLSVRPVIITECHVAPPSELQ